MPIREDRDSSIMRGKKEPLINKDNGFAAAAGTARSNESIGMVLLSTVVAVCGSIAFGSCIGYSASMQARIMEDISLSPSQMAGIPKQWAPTVGILMDHLRKNRSLEDLQANVQRLKKYKSMLVIFPRRSGKFKLFDGKEGRPTYPRRWVILPPFF